MRTSESISISKALIKKKEKKSKLTACKLNQNELQFVK